MSTAKARGASASPGLSDTSLHFTVPNNKRQKLSGRAFYESLGSPKFILAPMVEQSEFAWRMLSRFFMTAESSKDLLAYTPMFHSRMFTDTPKYRESHFQPTKSALLSPSELGQELQPANPDLHLDGNPAIDRPLFVQFCANSPDEFLEAAKHVQPFCDAVDLNLGCPQGIAKRGRYGAFLQEEWDTIYKLINKLHTELSVPVTAKMRVLETKEKTLEYAKKILSAGASIITVHGRRRDQKGHNTGLADWSVIRYLRENLPTDTVIFANGNVLRHEDIERCLEETGADGVMSAEGNLYDPTIFGEPPPIGQEGREYWRGRDGKGGYRMDAVLRRYMDIIYTHVLGTSPPERKPLFLASDPVEPAKEPAIDVSATDDEDEAGQPQRKRQKREKQQKCSSPNLSSMQAHCFHMLRPLVSKHTNVRDALARCKAGDVPAFENVLQMVEKAVKQGLIEYEKETSNDQDAAPQVVVESTVIDETKDASSLATVAMCKRPWWVCQPYVRPLPKEAYQNGALSLSKKEKARLAQEETQTKEVGLQPEGRVEAQSLGENHDRKVEIPKEGMVCG
ncbi:tRNA dihydrouridine synthase [Cryomyces antarcticus]|uniref:tRNA-dihydrouridine(16/17) synthase [NAD(P)(+)] n=1 Tax=Cryomyces antarcticus TaxID=329879 RepID=A0ABR0LQV6_9PEZI|nr:tRNA dihydrouridine synthase [Cryomyces antarcticus]